jgi:hypothetical protein
MPSAHGVFPIFSAAEEPEMNSSNQAVNVTCADNGQVMFPAYYPGYPHLSGFSPNIPGGQGANVAGSGAGDSNTGGLSTDTAAYAFQTLPELELSYYEPGQTGFYPYPQGMDWGFNNCDFGDTSNGTHNGIGVWTSGQFFIAGYDGNNNSAESWGDQFYIYNDDGLQVGQFGNTPYQNLQFGSGYQSPQGLYGQQLAGQANNIGSFQSTQPDSTSRIGEQLNGVIFLYHSDENRFGGIHRWSITNTNSVQETDCLANTSGILTCN